ncbi:tRNA N(3)-methylcytidine methyltransferase METTL8, mitochondrial isoform X4 [Accipiter gentilis]|uniref:tRNA N(3)-methylcytidine methyltransferase METTL8, mitochondrial isoform X4 n=1 Tax=Astur gentilis TaxID=8957 RepID=UPI00210F2C93|nr:tRNA N(3)-methylcytidine methyltransferase METTL8, mitochondrial isoform X4 [Accipiter gentilis]
MGDHMQWSQEEEENAKKKAAENSLVKVQWEDQDKYEREASKYWNEFYKTHKNNFFKDRNWLFLEFPEILPEKRREELQTEQRSSEHTKINSTNSFSHKNEMSEEGEKYWKKNYGGGSASVQGYVYNKNQAKSLTDNPQGKNCGEELGRLESFPGSDATYRILEVGCGAGNSVFPILKVLCNTPGTFLYCCDFASGAVELVKSHSSYNSAWCSAFVHDVCDDALPYPFPDEILDVILLVFVLSTIHPDRMQGVVNRLAKLLKPGGMLLFRDYGRYDTAQLRFKKGHCLSENFYVRGDGTRVYFFTKGNNVFTFFQVELYSDRSYTPNLLGSKYKRVTEVSASRLCSIKFCISCLSSGLAICKADIVMHALLGGILHLMKEGKRLLIGIPVFTDPLLSR